MLHGVNATFQGVEGRRSTRHVGRHAFFPAVSLLHDGAQLTGRELGIGLQILRCVGDATGSQENLYEIGALAKVEAHCLAAFVLSIHQPPSGRHVPDPVIWKDVPVTVSAGLGQGVAGGVDSGPHDDPVPDRPPEREWDTTGCPGVPYGGEAGCQSVKGIVGCPEHPHLSGRVQIALIRAGGGLAGEVDVTVY